MTSTYTMIETQSGCAIVATQPDGTTRQSGDYVDRRYALDDLLALRHHSLSERRITWLDDEDELTSGDDRDGDA